jgi:hypothetical protein
VFLNQLADVEISELTNGQVLAFSSGSSLWENSALSLGDLSNVSATLPPGPDQGDGAMLVFDRATNRWVASYTPRVDLVYLTTDDDAFTIENQRVSPRAQALISLDQLPANANRTYTLPNASGTFALQGQFTMSNVDGLAVAVPETGFAEATATCPTGSKAVGVGVSAFPAVAIQDMRILSATQVRVRARRNESTEPTNMNAVAFCMSMP